MPGSARESTVAVVPSAKVRVKGGATLPTLPPTSRGTGATVGVGASVGAGVGVDVGSEAVAVGDTAGGDASSVGEGSAAATDPTGVGPADEGAWVGVDVAVGAGVSVTGSAGVPTGRAEVGWGCTVACCSALGSSGSPGVCPASPQAVRAKASSTPPSNAKGLRSLRPPIEISSGVLPLRRYSLPVATDLLQHHGAAHGWRWAGQEIPLNVEG